MIGEVVSLDNFLINYFIYNKNKNFITFEEIEKEKKNLEKELRGKIFIPLNNSVLTNCLRDFPFFFIAIPEENIIYFRRDGFENFLISDIPNWFLSKELREEYENYFKKSCKNV
jgi:hypothetical protein